MASSKQKEKEVMEEIRKDLANRNRSVRALGCKSLAQFKNKASSYLLVQMLSDSDPDVRFHAAESILKIGTPAINCLITALSHSEWIVRKQSSDLLKKMADSDKSIITLLRDNLKSDDSNIKFWSVKTLCELKDDQIMPNIKKIFKSGCAEDKIAIAGAISDININDEFKLLLLNGLSDNIWRVRKACADALLKGGKNIINDVILKLSSDNIDTYYWATKILGMLKDDSAVEPLLEILKGDDDEKIEFAIIALGEIANPKATNSLIELLKSDSWTIRKNAAEAIMNIGEPVMPEVYKAYKSEDTTDDMRYWCVRIAYNFKCESSSKLIYEALFDTKWFIRSCACHALLKYNEFSNKHIEKLFLMQKEKNAEVRQSAEAVLNIIENDKLYKISGEILSSKDCPAELNDLITHYFKSRGLKQPAATKQIGSENRGNKLKEVTKIKIIKNK